MREVFQSSMHSSRLQGKSFPHHSHFGRRNSFHQAISLLIMTLILAPSAQSRCPFAIGVQMPKTERGKPYSKVVVYFVPPYKKAPKCYVDFGEAQIIQTNVGWVEITGKPETRVDIRCLEE